VRKTGNQAISSPAWNEKRPDFISGPCSGGKTKGEGVKQRGGEESLVKKGGEQSKGGGGQKRMSFVRLFSPPFALQQQKPPKKLEKKGSTAERGRAEEKKPKTLDASERKGYKPLGPRSVAAGPEEKGRELKRRNCTKKKRKAQAARQPCRLIKRTRGRRERKARISRPAGVEVNWTT